MNANAVAKHYGSLTPEERFSLILAAGARGDESPAPATRPCITARRGAASGATWQPAPWRGS